MRFLLVAALLVTMLFIWRCAEPLPDDVDPNNADAGFSAPANTVFAIGVWDNSGGAPQSASDVGLRFGKGVPDDQTVLAVPRTTELVLDGTAEDWAEIPASVLPLSARGVASGFSKEEWDTEYKLLTGSAPLWDFGIYEITVKAAYDADNVYFLLQWPDATEDRRRGDWTYDGVKWTRATNNEDKVSLSFNLDNTFRGFNDIGCAAACHLHTRLGDVSDAGRSHRTRMHTGRAGELADVWLWRSSTSNPMGYADDGYWDELPGRKGDALTDWSGSNSKSTDAGSVPLYMGEGGINSSPEYIFKDDAGSPRAVPFDGTDVVAGTKIPGYFMQQASPNRDDIRAAGKWSEGKWTVELSRARASPDPKDMRFSP